MIKLIPELPLYILPDKFTVYSSHRYNKLGTISFETDVICKNGAFKSQYIFIPDNSTSYGIGDESLFEIAATVQKANALRGI